MKRWHGVGAALLVALSSTAGAGAPAVGGLNAYEWPEFTVVARKDETAHRVASRVVAIQNVLDTLLGHKFRPTGLPTTIYVVEGGTWYGYFAPGRRIAAEFEPGRFSNYLLIGSTQYTRRSEFAAMHEYTHFYLHSQYRARLPLWVDEGFAKLVGGADVGLRGATLHRDPPRVAGSWIPIDRLIRIDKSSREYHTSANSTALHDESAGLVRRAVIVDREFGRRMFAYVAALDEGQSIDAAFQAGFGMTPEQLDAETRSFGSLDLTPDKFIPYTAQLELTAVKPRPLSETEALRMIAGVLLDMNRNVDGLTGIAHAIERRAPSSGVPDLLRLRLALRAHDDAAATALLERMEKTITDPSIARDAGLGLFERIEGWTARDVLPESGRSALSARAFELLRTALAAHPDDPQAAWAFGALAAEHRQSLPVALAYLDRACARVPLNGDLEKSRALVRMALGDGAGGRESLRAVMNNARSLTDRQWAKRQLEP